MTSFGTPNTYFESPTGAILTPADDEITWKPEENWERYPVRISMRTSTDPMAKCPYGYGYIYSTSPDFKSVKIHVVNRKENEFIFESDYLEDVFDNTLDYFKAHTYFRSKKAHHEWFIEVNYKNEWIYMDILRRLLGDDTRKFSAVLPGVISQAELEEPLPPVPVKPEEPTDPKTMEVAQ